MSDGGRTGRPQKEVIEPEAFSYRVDLPDEDIHLLVGHSFDAPLASKLTDTLMLKDSREALTFEAIIPPAIAETTHGRTPRAGFEPATNRLTAGCSTTELPGNGAKARSIGGPL